MPAEFFASILPFSFIFLWQARAASSTTWEQRALHASCNCRMATRKFHWFTTEVADSRPGAKGCPLQRSICNHRGAYHGLLGTSLSELLHAGHDAAHTI